MGDAAATGDVALARGMTAQLGRWRERLEAGEERLGWKIALNVPAVQERLGLSSPAVGYLTSAARLAPGTSHSLAGGTRIAAEPEIAVELGRDVPQGAHRAVAQDAIASLRPAIEVVDIDLPFEDLAEILEANVFQRAVVFGDRQTVRGADLPDEVLVRVERNGREEVSGPRAGGGEVVDAVRLVADLLGRFGERLRAGDTIIAGSLTDAIWVGPGDRLTAEIRPLGSVALTFIE